MDLWHIMVQNKLFDLWMDAPQHPLSLVPQLLLLHPNKRPAVILSYQDIWHLPHERFRIPNRSGGAERKCNFHPLIEKPKLS
ncbi:hypothetical protein AOLI_G00018730 [Acnodon oligacanthus]